MKQTVSAAALARLTLFEGFRPEQLRRLAAAVTLANYPAGTEIFAAGDRANRLFIVCAGEVVIRFRPYDGGALDMANIPAGGAFGWSAALKRSYYTSAAIARTEVQALVVQAQDLHRIMASDPETGSMLLARSARQAASGPADPPRWVTPPKQRLTPKAGRSG